MRTFRALLGQEMASRRSSLVAGLLTAGLLASAPAATAAAAAAAAARIVVGESIAGVRLGETQAQVIKALGRPKHSAPGSVLGPKKYSSSRTATYSWGEIEFVHGRVYTVVSLNARQRTPAGIAIGSTLTQVTGAYPHARCTATNQNQTSCVLKTRSRRGPSWMEFVLQGGSVAWIRLEEGAGPFTSGGGLV
jgi:hypothetical protein